MINDEQSLIAPDEVIEQEESPDLLPSVPDAFEVKDRGSANWLIRKIVETRAYAKHVKAWAAAEVRRAEREERFFFDHYGPQLEAWAREQIARLHRIKSLKLPAGTVGYRAEPSRLDVSDETKLIGWCRRSLPDALRVDTHILKSIIKDHVEKTGECPDGTEMGGGGQRFYIK